MVMVCAESDTLFGRTDKRKIVQGASKCSTELCSLHIYSFIFIHLIGC